MSFTKRVSLGSAPVALDDMKSYLRVTSTADDDLISAMIEAATTHAEMLCGRDFRDSSYEMVTTSFGDLGSIEFPYRFAPFNYEPLSDAILHIKRATVDTVDSIEHLVGGTFTAVPSSVYYYSKRVLKTYLLPKEGQDWPTDTDDVEDNVRITYTMEIPDGVSVAILGIQRHVAFMYEERGDCTINMVGGMAGRTSALSGAEGFYQSLLVPRF